VDLFFGDDCEEAFEEAVDLRPDLALHDEVREQLDVLQFVGVVDHDRASVGHQVDRLQDAEQALVGAEG